jgi:serine/threonine protein kinase
MYRLLIGSFPFKGKTDDDIKSQILEAKLVFPENAMVSNQAIDLLKKILHPSKKKRINFDDILIHEFFCDN